MFNRNTLAAIFCLLSFNLAYASPGLYDNELPYFAKALQITHPEASNLVLSATHNPLGWINNTMVILDEAAAGDNRLVIRVRRLSLQINGKTDICSAQIGRSQSMTPTEAFVIVGLCDNSEMSVHGIVDLSSGNFQKADIHW